MPIYNHIIYVDEIDLKNKRLLQYGSNSSKKQKLFDHILKKHFNQGDYYEYNTKQISYIYQRDHDNESNKKLLYGNNLKKCSNQDDKKQKLQVTTKIMRPVYFAEIMRHIPTYLIR